MLIFIVVFSLLLAYTYYNTIGVIIVYPVLFFGIVDVVGFVPVFKSIGKFSMIGL